MKITGKGNNRSTEMTNIHNFPSRKTVLPLKIIVNEAELLQYLKVHNSFWDSQINPIIIGIMTGRDMTEATAFYYKHAHHLMHELLGVDGTCEKADSILEKIIIYKLINNTDAINNRLPLLILGSKALTFTYREWLPQILQEFEISNSINQVTELLSARAFTEQKTWPTKQRASLKLYLNMFTDFVQYFLLTRSGYEQNSEYKKFFNTQLDQTPTANLTFLN